MRTDIVRSWSGASSPASLNAESVSGRDYRATPLAAGIFGVDEALAVRHADHEPEYLQSGADCLNGKIYPVGKECSDRQGQDPRPHDPANHAPFDGAESLHRADAHDGC